MMRRLEKLRSVEARTAKGHSTIYREMAAGIFPRPVPTGTNSVAWVSDEIDLWQEALKAFRDGMLDAFMYQREAEKGTLEPWLVKLADTLRNRAA